MKAIVFGADNFEDSELLCPYYRFKEAGIEAHIVGTEKGVITGKYGYKVNVDKAVSEINPQDYGVIIIPGGRAPEHLRLNEGVLSIVKYFFKKNLPVGAICHGAQVLISAGVVGARRATCWQGMRDDLKAAGAKFEDKEVVVDGNLVTSRMPQDLPAFLRELMKLVEGKAR